jgi:3-deoxy-manno-octulosonate cytidylyltransferase (CMP-KDO synthetase)
MICHVCEKAAASSADMVLVATDDSRIFDTVEASGYKAAMTRSDHPSGTDRIYEAISGTDAQIIINVQGDEPLIPTSVINELIKVMQDNPDLPMATVAVKLEREFINDPNKVKVIFGKDQRAIYFSRAPIPFLRDGGTPTPAYLHWGIYAYRKDILERFVQLPPGKLENSEKLEQLRALENGIGIKVITTVLTTIGVDTPEDLARAEASLKGQL